MLEIIVLPSILSVKVDYIQFSFVISVLNYKLEQGMNPNLDSKSRKTILVLFGVLIGEFFIWVFARSKDY